MIWLYWTPKKPLTPELNEDVHGGSIISDIALISTFPEQESNRLKLWKNAFELAYGIPYHRLQKIAKDLPDQLRVVRYSSFLRDTPIPDSHADCSVTWRKGSGGGAGSSARTCERGRSSPK